MNIGKYAILLFAFLAMGLSGCEDRTERVQGECLNGTDSTASINVFYNGMAMLSGSFNQITKYTFSYDPYLPSCADFWTSTGLKGATFPSTTFGADTTVDYAGCRYTFTEPHHCYNGTIIARAVDLPDTDSALSNLTLSSGTLSPDFSPVTQSYAVTVANDVTTITITPSTRTDGASVKVNNVPVGSGSASGSISLSLGQNPPINVAVTSKNGSKTTVYSLVVTRSQSNSAKIVALRVAGAVNSSSSEQSTSLTPGFEVNTLEYSVKLPKDYTVFGLYAVPDKNGSKMTLDGQELTPQMMEPEYKIRNVPIQLGSHTFQLIVTAPDGVTTRTYLITITRGDPLSTDATLSGLGLSTGSLSPSFSSATTSYSATVANATTTIRLTPTVHQSNATVKVNGVTTTSGTASSDITLATGSNNIPVVVTAQDGTTQKTYTVNVTRQSPPSSNANLSNLALDSDFFYANIFHLQPNFDPSTTTYDLTAARGFVTVAPTTQDQNASIKVDNRTVISGYASDVIVFTANSPKQITIRVTAQDGTTTKDYVIHATWDGINR